MADERPRCVWCNQPRKLNRIGRCRACHRFFESIVED